MNKKLFLLLVLLMQNIFVLSQVTLPNFFGDNMVLQRNKLIPIWGFASPNEKISVSFHNQKKTTKTDINGKWIIKLDAESAGGPYQLVINGKNTVLFKNVLVGEVWLCSGQSNMEFSVWQSKDSKKDIISADYPMIRHIKIERDINTLPQNNIIPTSWKVCDSSSVGGFTAAGYYFARNIYNELKIPIGIIHSSWGGTNIETWISREAFEESDEFKEMISDMPKLEKDSFLNKKNELIKKRISNAQGYEFRNPSNPDSFKELEFDDSKWASLKMPQPWEKQSLVSFNGVVWLRKNLTLTAEDIRKNAILELAQTDNEDVTYVNGIRVGGKGFWGGERKYPVKKDILKEGNNTIAIRLLDRGGNGGFYGNPDDMKLILGSSEFSLSGDWKFKVESIMDNLNENEFPSLAYNAMINPLIPFAFAGVLWYQGEANAWRSFQYRKAFPLLINDWRKKWNQGNFPFYYVQLATYKTDGDINNGCGWAELREAQTMTLSLPNTGMIVTTDIGDPNDIHPTNKQEVGRRLSLLALNYLYDKKTVSNYPTYLSMEIKNNQLILSFDNIGGGLMTTDKYGYVKGFEIAGKDKIFHFARAIIKDNKIILENENIKNPVATCFGWLGDASDCNLFNKEGLPVIPFRTFEWKNITQEEKFNVERLK